MPIKFVQSIDVYDLLTIVPENLFKAGTIMMDLPMSNIFKIKGAQRLTMGEVRKSYNISVPLTSILISKIENSECIFLSGKSVLNSKMEA